MNILEMCENMDICELFKQLEEENDVEVIEMDDEEVTDEEVLDIFINEDGCGNSVMDSLMIASIAFELFPKEAEKPIDGRTKHGKELHHE